MRLISFDAPASSTLPCCSIRHFGAIDLAERKRWQPCGLGASEAQTQRSAKAVGALADRVAVGTPRTGAVAPIGLRRCGLGGGRHRRDRLQDLRSNLVGVALRIRAAIF